MIFHTKVKDIQKNGFLKVARLCITQKKNRPSGRLLFTLEGGKPGSVLDNYLSRPSPRDAPSNDESVKHIMASLSEVAAGRIASFHPLPLSFKIGVSRSLCGSD